MFDNIDTVDTVPARDLAGIRRRANVRYLCHLANPARFSPPETGPTLAWVRNLSVAGAGLLLDSPLEDGRSLEIELFTTTGDRVRVCGRVAHVTQRSDGSWLVGCEFSEPISADQLETLL